MQHAVIVEGEERLDIALDAAPQLPLLPIGEVGRHLGNLPSGRLIPVLEVISGSGVMVKQRPCRLRRRVFWGDCESTSGTVGVGNTRRVKGLAHGERRHNVEGLDRCGQLGQLIADERLDRPRSNVQQRRRGGLSRGRDDSRQTMNIDVYMTTQLL